MLGLLRWLLNPLALCSSVTVLLLAASCGPQDAPPAPSDNCVGAVDMSECREVIVGGTSRSFLLHVPASFQEHSGALVVVLHGSGGTGAELERQSQMTLKSEEMGFAVVYPYAVGVVWHNYFDDLFWTGQTPPDDVAFMRALVRAVEADVHPDPKKVYFAGFSNGGLLAHRLAIEMADIVAAIGVVEGALFGFGGNLQDVPPAQAPVSVLELHGDGDTAIPYCAERWWASQEATFNYWAQTAANGCTKLDSAAPLCDVQGRITTLDEKSATGCNGGAEVKFYRLIGGQHVWYSCDMNVPGQTPYNPALDATTGIRPEVWPGPRSCP